MSDDPKTPYRVLARKYRPGNFDELIGQDALVRTLKNAIESGRIAHAFMLTGIRGTGKTTTARIIAKALNYTGPDGKAGPTTGPTDDCAICKAISEDRHPDVLEMDAASHTGVDDIRDILDGVRYAPTSARYKVYIIDEVHMLSKAAFNALLKTLEEPPEHVKFIFATTEIRKVPVTVLSRCQRFDLRRVDADTLAAYYKTICDKEKAKAEDEALGLISRAADGSVRDGLSLLDQAISLGGDTVTAAQVKEMLGLADQALSLDLLEHALKGETAKALAIMQDMYKSGADPLVLTQDLLDFTHILTRFRAVPDMGSVQSVTISSDMQARAADLAGALSMPTLGRAWQILLKGIQEVATAPNPQAAAEMLAIRLAYAADLPDPAELIKKLQADGGANVSGAVPMGAPVTPRSAGGGAANASASAASPTKEPAMVEAPKGSGGSMAALAVAEAEPETEAFELGRVETLEDVVKLLDTHKEMILASEVYHNVHPVKVAHGRLTLRQNENARPNLMTDLRTALIRITGEQWMVVADKAAGAPTLAEQAQARQRAEVDAAAQHPVVKAVLEAFPEAQIHVKDIETDEL